MHALARTNPFFAARFRRVADFHAAATEHEPQQPVYARLPRHRGTAARCRT